MIPDADAVAAGMDLGRVSCDTQGWDSSHMRRLHLTGYPYMSHTSPCTSGLLDCHRPGYRRCRCALRDESGIDLRLFQRSAYDWGPICHP